MRSADVRKIPRGVQAKLVPAWPGLGLVGVGTGLGKEEEEGLQESRQAKREHSSLRTAVRLSPLGVMVTSLNEPRWDKPWCQAACPWGSALQSSWDAICQKRGGYALLRDTLKDEMSFCGFPASSAQQAAQQGALGLCCAAVRNLHCFASLRLRSRVVPSCWQP